MIVDDEMDVLTVLDKRFKADGYNVIAVNNGNDAIKKAGNQLPDLIILDVGLGDMHGGEVALQLQQNPATADIPYIFLSALYSKQDQMEKTNIFGGKALFSKPYNFDEILQTVRNLI